MKNFLPSAGAALAALLLVGPLAQAQQSATPTPTTPTKTALTTKKGKSRGNAQMAPLPAPGALAGPATPPAGPPRPPHPGPDGPAGMSKPGPAGPGKPGPGGPPAHRVQALSEFSGTLTDYTAANDDQLYDGFTLKTTAATETVRFPRHLAQALLAAAKAGSPVTVTGFRDTDPQGHSQLHLVSLTANGQTVRTQKPSPPATPLAEQATSVTGTVRSLTQDAHGRTNALVLSDGTLLRLAPDAAAQLADHLKVGATVAATGTLHTPRPGEVAARPVRAVRVETITLNGVQFLVN